MLHDRVITISAAGSRKATRWPPQTLLWSELAERLRTPARSTETLTAYLRLPKAQQDELKDVGGYVGGALAGERRKACNVAGRDVVTLDMDAIPAGGTDEALRRIAGLGCGYAVYSTRKHEPARPRLRALVLLHRTCTAEEYEPIARRLAQWIGIEWCDPSTFEASRLMYWPSCCADGQYIYAAEDKPMLDADAVLHTYTDWRDVATWPQVPGAPERQAKQAAKQEDPTSKRGVVGAFCRAYDVPRALAELIPGEYEPCGNDGGRLTYTGGSTTGGAVLYDDGLYLYSHHATDPAGGKLCNAFDLVRLHKYGALDDDAKADTPPNRLPSYAAMCRFAVGLPEVAYMLSDERTKLLQDDFSAPVPGAAGDENWKLKCVPGIGGMPDRVGKNVKLMLELDPALAGKLRHDAFADRVVAQGPLPWGKHKDTAGEILWTDSDDAGLRLYAETQLGFRTKDLIEDALRDHLARHSYHPVRDYLRGLVWDGKPRVDTLLIDYLGAEDTEYTRTVTRKTLVAAVARVMTPGVKKDEMLILGGPQGIGKSTLWSILGGAWFTDALTSFDGKDASELIQGIWIAEIGELEALNKSDANRVKQFISQQHDRYRAAYGRRAEEHPRQCIFVGTTNDDAYIRDATGGRRYWPVNVSGRAARSVWQDLPAVRDQVWAEAYVDWQLGEALTLDARIAAEAVKQQEAHRDVSPWAGPIARWLDRKVPSDWLKWDSLQRAMYWGGNTANVGDLIERDRVCALEVWVECLGGDMKRFSRRDAAEINNILAGLPGWYRPHSPIRCGPYGIAKGFCRQEISKAETKG